jgi:hypothetical protein
MQRDSGRKGFYDQFLHSCDALRMSLLLLSGLPRAGVFTGLDSESKDHPDDPPATRRGGFLISVVSNQRSASESQIIRPSLDQTDN